MSFISFYVISLALNVRQRGQRVNFFSLNFSVFPFLKYQVPFILNKEKEKKAAEITSVVSGTPCFVS